MSPSQSGDVPRVPGYTDIERVGRGGFSLVYRATHERLGRPVALKVLMTDLVEAQDVRRFEAECRALGALGEHPNIVDVYDAGITPDGRPYIAMRLYTRGTLADGVASAGPMPADEVMDVGMKMAHALDYAHGHGVIHRDIKPENILVGDAGEPVLSDFGVAAMADDAGRYTTSVAFTSAHVAPEVLDRNEYGIPSDIYALGSTMYSLIAGRAVFESTSEAQRIVATMTTEPPPLHEPACPPALWAVLHTCLQKDPSNRFASAAALAAALVQASGEGEYPAGGITKENEGLPGEAVPSEGATILRASGTAGAHTPQPRESGGQNRTLDAPTMLRREGQRNAGRTSGLAGTDTPNPVSRAAYAWAILGIVGGLVAYFIFRGRDPQLAKRVLVAGVLVGATSIVVSGSAIALIALAGERAGGQEYAVTTAQEDSTQTTPSTPSQTPLPTPIAIPAPGPTPRPIQSVPSVPRAASTKDPASAGWPPYTYVGPDNLDVCLTPSYPLGRTLLTTGAGNASGTTDDYVVRSLQAGLRALNYGKPNPIPVDGDFGPLTEQAVRSFQSNKALVVDGKVGQETWGALHSWLNNYAGIC